MTAQDHACHPSATDCVEQGRMKRAQALACLEQGNASQAKQYIDESLIALRLIDENESGQVKRLRKAEHSASFQVLASVYYALGDAKSGDAVSSLASR